MIVQCRCPHCQKDILESVRVECLEDQIFDSEESAKRYILKNVIIKTLPHTELVDVAEKGLV